MILVFIGAEVTETTLNSRESEDTNDKHINSKKEEGILEKTTLTFRYCNQLAEKKPDYIIFFFLHKIMIYFMKLKISYY